MMFRIGTLLFILFATGAGVQNSSAMPAAPTTHLMQQSDGASLSARQWGDEYLSGWETVDGYTIVYDTDLRCWTYAVPDRAGNLVSSGGRPDRIGPPAGVSKRIRPKNSPAAGQLSVASHALSLQQLSATSSQATVPSPAAPAAAVTRNLPVILINFSDTATTYTNDDFTSLLFGTGSWSLREYFEEVSRGTFSISPGPAGVVGWVTASREHDYYGARSGWGPPDVWPGDLAYEAIQLADAVVDFSVYDNDGDCSVETVAVVHQGNAQEWSGLATDIWSHSWSLSLTHSYFLMGYNGLSHYGPYSTNDRCASNPSQFVVVDRYIMMPEKYGDDIAGIGVFGHEYGHALGLVDLYDSDNSSEGAGNWSLMASGSWGGVGRLGNRPSHPDPWSKAALGWLTPVKVVDSSVGKVIDAVEGSGEVSQFRLRLSEGGTGEYFLLENRQKTGFDEALPGAGLLLWHIDEARSSNNGEWYPGCTSCTSHYKVALVQADGLYQLEQKINRGDAGDPFPGTAANRAITPWTPLPAALYGSIPAGFGISSISDPGMTMTADVTIFDLVPPVTEISSYPPATSASRSGRFTFHADEPATFECRQDNGPFIPCTSPFLFADLSDGSHTFTVRATDVAGNVETSPPGYAWTLDTVAPLCNVQLNDACHQSIAAAYAAILDGTSGTIQLKQGDYLESLDLNRDVAVRLQGGYNSDFTARPAKSAIAGRVAVSAGSLTVSHIGIRFDQP